MPGTLQVGGNTVITHTGDAGAGTNTLSSSVAFNNRLIQIAKNATDAGIQTGFITSTSYTWGNSSIEVSITPNKAGNLLMLNAYATGYNDSNDMRSFHTFLISPDNGTTLINVATDSNGMGLTSTDYVTNFYHYSGTDFGTGASNMLGYYTTQNTNPLKIRSSTRVANGQFKFFGPHVIICYEYEVVS